MTAVGEIEVPIAANGTLQKAALVRLARAAEEEMPQALNLQIRLSLLYTPLGGRPELYGYSFSGARLRVQRVQSRLASNASEGMVVVHAIAEPPSLFFFKSAVASKEVQVLAEVLAYEDAPKKPAVGSTVPASRIWKLAVPVAKAKPQPKAQAKAKAKTGNSSLPENPEQAQTQLDQPFKPLGPSPGGRAESAWPLSGGTYPAPLYADPPPECVLAWALLRFDLATESRSALKAELRPGKLREHLAKNLPGKSTAAAEAELSRLFAATFKAKQPPLLECDVQVIPLDDAPRRLLPHDFPAVTESHRMGGLEVIEDVSGLQIDGALSANALDPDVTVRGLLVTLPDAGWMESFLRSVPQPLQMAGVPASVAWELQELHVLVGSHNTLRWLDEPLRGLTAGMAAHYPLDDTGHTWRLKLDKLEDGQRFWFGGEVPVEFVCHPDCAVIVELVAVLRAPGAAAPPVQATQAATTPLLADPGQPQDLLQKKTLGWLLLLPFYQTTSEGLLKAAAVSGERPSLAFDVQFYGGPGLSMLAEEVWSPAAQGPTTISTRPAETAKPSRPALSASRISCSFQLCGDRLIQWLRQHIPLPKPEIQEPPPKPMTLQPLPSVSPQTALAVPAAQGLPYTPPQLAPTQPASALPVPVQAPLPAQGLAVYQPTLAPASMVVAAPAPAPAPVVEKIYLRDQAVQSDPPAIQGVDDNFIGDAKPKASSVATETGPPARPLSAVDKANLLQGTSGAGLKPPGPSVPAGESVPPKRELRWKFEDEDMLQADEISLELLTLRSFSPVDGERIYFQLRFFQFPPVRTVPAALSGKPGEACLLRSAVTNERLAMVFHMDGYVNGSVATSAASVHRHLVNYLDARSADIEIWSAESGMHIGSTSVPLEMLVRQGHQVAKVEAEYAVLEPLSGEPKGTLRMLLVNRGRTPTPYQHLNSNNLPSPPPDDKGHPQPPPAPSPPRGRTRHKVSALIEPGSELHGAQHLTGQATVAEELSQRKHERLKQLRMLRKSDLQADPFSNHSVLLAAAESARQERKKQEVARRMDRFNTTQQSLTASFATPSYFCVDFTNPYGQQAVFSVLVTGDKPRAPEVLPAVPPQQPLQGVLMEMPEQALMLVKDPEEWRRLVSLGVVPTAPSGDFSRLAAGSFVLNPKESISLPFRYLDFNFPGFDTTAQLAPPSGLRLADVAAVVAGPSRKDFRVEVALDHGPVMRCVEVSVVSQPTSIDRTVRFFEAEGTAAEKAVALPPSPDPSSGSCYVYCTSREVHVQRKEEDQVSLRFIAPQSPNVLSFFLVFYADPHFNQVVAIQLIDIQGLRTERIRLVVGQSVERAICLAPAEVLDAGAVRLHSSNSEVVNVQHTAEVDPRYGVKFTVLITSMQVGSRACRLHAVDPAMRRLVAALLVVVAADPPEVKMVHSITLPVLTAVRKRLLYKNEAVRPIKYIVRCSEPALLTVQSPELVINSLDTRCIELLFHAVPATLSYNAEVFLFITSEDRAIHETRMLELAYT